MSDTFFSGAPHWTWFIIPYFYVGGLAGGACFLAAILEWFGKPEDRPVVRAGYDVAAVGAILSGLLLTVDLGQPLRFWHMLFQSEHFPAIMFKAWSPISFGAWAILLFGLFSVLSALGARAEEGRLRNAALRAVGGVVRGGLAKFVSGVGGLLGFFVAGYTGVLLSVTNRPIWADSPWLGALRARGRAAGARPLPRLPRIDQPGVARRLGAGPARRGGGRGDSRPAAVAHETRAGRQARAARRLPAAARHHARLRGNRPLPTGGWDVACSQDVDIAGGWG
ncbi:MAG: hypothetical protein DMD69_00250 [Gemmatimonadetes bacterium]|nr:MAG: hypothetical protein DMD69_00250 [Gemmatimonadota bacterium]